MSTTENKAYIQQYLAALSGKAKPPALVNQYIADTDDALRQHIAGAEAAFPHYEMIVDDLIAEGDKVVVRFTMRATHQGDFMGIPATGKQVNMPGIIIYHIADHKIVEHWMQFDAMTLMQQLGVQP
ncbi:MAG: ester cyclase [Chloroflexi bacterium]|nr:MAG: ester cyclase [Chloroflexota bacterium]